MEEKLVTIREATKILGVSIDTLRRWDKAGSLKSVRYSPKGHRYYNLDDLKMMANDLFSLAKNWAVDSPALPKPEYYCPDSLVFKTRLGKLENDLSKINEIKNIFPLISAIVGEIGNNSYDHNLGNWPDIRGIFFAYDLNKKQIVLADRGQGILKTLRKVRPELSSDEEALEVAFTEIISGRAPEARGNGLKFVRQVISDNNLFSIEFYSGGAKLFISHGSRDLNIKKSDIIFSGCISLIKF